MTNTPRSFKWFVYKKVGDKKEDDVKVSKGFSRDWQALNKLNEIKNELPDEENETKFYVRKEYRDQQ